MAELIHYILVRRDLPFGKTLAMVGHAAADSMEQWARSWLRYKRKHLPITMVVLGVEDVRALVRAREKLTKAGLLHVPIRDNYYLPDGSETPISLLAIGVEPGARDFLAPFFKGYGTYKAPQGEKNEKDSVKA